MFMRIGAAAVALAAGTLCLIYVNTQSPDETTAPFVGEARADTTLRQLDYGWRTSVAEYGVQEGTVAEFYSP